MIQLGNNGEWVNPTYVTSIVPHQELLANNQPITNKKSKIWVVGHAGYGTYSIYSSLSPDEVAKKINKARGRTPVRSEDITKNY